MSERRVALQAMNEMLAAGVGVERSASVLGVHPSTLSRWRRRARESVPLAQRRGPRARHCDEPSRDRATALVRELRGLVGVESLRHSVVGLTRREAAEIKGQIDELMQM